MRTAIMLLAVLAVVLAAGQAAAQNYGAAIDGAQEAPPNASLGSGTGVFNLDGAKMFTFTITFAGLGSAEINAHIHGPAPLGLNAAAIFPLPAGTPKNGVVGPLSPAQEADLNAGLWYVNIHSANIPGGEIRGQILASVPTEENSWGAIKALYTSD